MVFLFVGVVLVAVQGTLIGPLTARHGSASILRAGLITVGVGLAVLSFSTVWVALFVALFLLSFGQGIATPSITALVSEAAPPNRRGEALGYQQSVGALARIAGPVLAGLMFDNVGIGSPYLVGAALFVVALLAVVSMPRAAVVK